MCACAFNMLTVVVDVPTPLPYLRLSACNFGRKKIQCDGPCFVCVSVYVGATRVLCVCVYVFNAEERA